MTVVEISPGVFIAKAYDDSLVVPAYDVSSIVPAPTAATNQWRNGFPVFSDDHVAGGIVGIPSGPTETGG